MRSQLAEAEVSEQVIDALVGHEIKGSTGAKVYTHRSLLALKKAVEVLHYPPTQAIPKIIYPGEHGRP